MFKYIFALLVIGISWGAAFVLKDRIAHGYDIAIAITILTILVLVGVILYRKWRARRAAREIEKALNAQAEEHARTVRPEQQAEVRAMQAEVTRAIASLKSSKLGKSGSEALYALPWYVIIGPPGSGKTTALRASGLNFPYATQSGGGVRGVGGTRNCEWWLTNEAVLLDTAGRYMTADDDRDEWLSFLDLLRKHRPEKPLNGVIVAVSVADLLGAREPEIEAVAKRVRERVDEVLGQLQMSMPVYLMFTKCDLIAGFSEYYGDLRKNERGQIWGFTFPLGQTLASPGAAFNERFDELVKVVDQRKFRRVAGEPKLEVREAVYQFPQQFAGAKQNLSDFVETLFSTNVYQGAPAFRGVYFTSGTQEGRPIDRLTQKLRDTLGLPQTQAPAQQVTEAKSFFLRDVFARVVFPDAEVAARSPEELRRQRRQRYMVAAGAFATAAVILTIPAIAYVENRDFVRESDAEVMRITSRGNSAAPLTLAELEPVRQRVEQLRKWETGTEMIPPYMRFGMYKGADIYPDVSRLYSQALRRNVIDPLAQRDLRGMRDFVARHPGGTAPTGQERNVEYDVLKTHLLLSPTTPPTANEPSTHDQKAYLTRALVAAWSLGASPSQADLAAMNANIAAYLDQLQDRPQDLALTRDVATVRALREVLNRTSTVDLALEGIINNVAQMGYDITLPRALGRSPEHVFQVGPQEGRVVRGAFTRRGWEEYVRDRLNQAPEEIVGEAWVLGQTRNAARADQLASALADVRSQYFQQYIAEWRNFVASLRVREPADPNMALQMLQWFTQGGSPAYVYLMRTVAENTRLLDPNAAATNAASSSLLAAAAATVNQQVQAQGRTGLAASNAATAALAARGGQTADVVDNRRRREDVENDPLLHGLVEFGVPPAPAPSPAPAAGAPPAPPPAAPGPTALTEYQEQLAFVRDALQTHIDNPAANTQPMLTALQTAQTRVEALINGGAVDARPVLRNLLPPPIDFTVRRATAGLAGAGSDRWCSAVVVPFARTLANRYPFAVGGQDAALNDVADFYRPTRGAVWGFYTEALTGDIARQGDQYEFVTRLGNDMGENYRPELRTFLNRSQDLSTVLFPSGSEAPRVDFEVRLRATPSIAELTFTADGETMQYRNGPPEWHTYHWPGAGAVRGAKIRARGLNGTDETIEQEGEWGLFRLFEAGVVRGSPEARIFSVVWRLRDVHNEGIEIGVDVRPARSENPFFGVPRSDNAQVGHFMLPFRADGVIAPHPIARRGGHPCNLAGVPGMPAAPAAPSGSSHHHRHH